MMKVHVFNSFPMTEVTEVEFTATPPSQCYDYVLKLIKARQNSERTPEQVSRSPATSWQERRSHTPREYPVASIPTRTWTPRSFRSR
jgi:hypothetical protein